MIKRKDKFAFHLANKIDYSESLQEASKYVVSDIQKWLKDLDKAYTVKTYEPHSTHYSNYRIVHIRIYHLRYKNTVLVLDKADKEMIEYLKDYKYESGLIEQKEYDENGEVSQSHYFIIKSKPINGSDFLENKIRNINVDVKDKYMALEITLYAVLPKDKRIHSVAESLENIRNILGNVLSQHSGSFTGRKLSKS